MTDHKKMRNMLEKVEDPKQKKVQMAIPFLDLVDPNGPANLLAWMHSRNNIRESKRDSLRDLEHTLVVIVLLVLGTMIYKLLEVFEFKTGLISADGASIQVTLLFLYYSLNLFEVVFVGAQINNVEGEHVNKVESLTFDVEEMLNVDKDISESEKESLRNNRELLNAMADKMRHQQPIQVLGVTLTQALLSTLVSGVVSASGALLSSIPPAE
eukprot:TRINITY_DN3342_c0_g1_i1.p1 TRINITY_DN3342_c0_g1~~TRINITY_DN3342_c0_g1_i1.p1  ORF type:complete len:233 (+),score=86.15 TRINITY_DN3342_c0_g1_i1:65-700(+)